MKLNWPRALILVVVFPAMSPAAQGVDPVTPPEAARAADDSRLICKSQPQTGSRLQKRTCQTKAQWEEARLQHQRDLKEMADRPLICGGSGSAEGCGAGGR